MALSLLRPILDLILPPVCVSCKSIIQDPQSLCPTCWEKMTFISDPCCIQCGWPFSQFIEQEIVCPGCLLQPPAFTKARFVTPYQDIIRGIILKFKHGDATHVGPLLSNWMVHFGSVTLKDADALVPVPLHWRRLLKRGYNQSMILAQGISKLTGISIRSRWLVRSQSTLSQGGLTLRQRQTNVSQAFDVPASHHQSIKDKIIVLVDDVFTTGATLNACAKTLLNTGAKEVRALAIARVLRPKGA